MGNAGTQYAVIITDHGIEFPGVVGDSAGNPLALGEDHVIGIGAATKNSTGEEVVVVKLIGGTTLFLPPAYVKKINTSARYKAVDDDAFFRTVETLRHIGNVEEIFTDWTRDFELATIIARVVAGDTRIHVSVAAVINRMNKALNAVKDALCEPENLTDAPAFLEAGIPFIAKNDLTFSQLITAKNIPKETLRMEFHSHIQTRRKLVEELLPHISDVRAQEARALIEKIDMSDSTTEEADALEPEDEKPPTPDEAYELGCFFRDGTSDTEKDPENAVRYFRFAAEQGHPDAQNCLGACYETGNGIEPNPQIAFGWYAKAAQQDNAKALFNLGRCLEHGIGCDEIDLPAAKECYARSLELGHKDAEYRLWKVKELLKQRNQTETDAGIPWGDIAKGAAALAGGALAFAAGFLGGSKASNNH